jgi:hypothetical protein
MHFQPLLHCLSMMHRLDPGWPRCSETPTPMVELYDPLKHAHTAMSMPHKVLDWKVIIVSFDNEMSVKYTHQISE